MSDQAVIFTQFFLDPEVIFSSHINASTNEFTPTHLVSSIAFHTHASE